MAMHGDLLKINKRPQKEEVSEGMLAKKLKERRRNI